MISTPTSSEQPEKPVSDDSVAVLEALDAKINAILPPRYIGCFEDVPSSSMGSASLKYDKNGKVAWDAIWTTFCHLALAGGPPHRGKFLSAVSAREAVAHPTEQAAVMAEIKRAIKLICILDVIEEAPPGWVAIRCRDEDMAAWMVRAIVAENVIAKHTGEVLFVPAGPHFRIEKEIKNVVVCVAKSCHYLLDHVEPESRPRGFGSELIQPPSPEQIELDQSQYQSVLDEFAKQLARELGMPTIESTALGWIGIQCLHEEMAVWMQRAVVVENVLARREGEVLFVPVTLTGAGSAVHEKVGQTLRESLLLWHLHSAAIAKKGPR